MTDRTESTFGAYTLHERIGMGGMAEAYVATREGSTTPCVLKLIRDADNALALARMRQEAHAGIHLAHDNVVRTLDAGTIAGTFYIAVELIVGEDLRRVGEWFTVNGERAPVAFVVGVMRQALAGLAYAHSAKGPDGAPLGVVHRDLSPGNLMIDQAGCLKIIDFGLVHAELGDPRTRPGMLMGTLAYISPEQARGETVDGRGDLYALSVVAYELLAGRRVARGIRPADVVRSILTDTTRPVEELRDEVPPQLARALGRGLEKERDDRYADAAEYLAALEGLEAHDADAIAAHMHEAFPELADRRTRWTSIGDQEPTQVPTRAAPAPPRPDPPSPRLAPVILAAIAVAIVAVVATVAWMSTPPPAPLLATPTSPAVEPKPAVTPKAAAPPETSPRPTPPRTTPPRRPPPRRLRRAPPAPADEVKVERATPDERIARLDARLRRLDARGVDPERTERLRADLTFVRASGNARPEALDRLERAVDHLERGADP
ncbi:MAG: serine/threonine-protein kinase [Deltaproteobacteria bacterium]|jgi:serine/threonine protein kinase